MNVPPPTAVNATLTVTQDTKGALQYKWSGAYVDSSGNFTLTSIKGVIQMTITISTSLVLSFCPPAADTMWLGKASLGDPTKPYSGTEFSTPAFVNNSSGVLQWTDQNGDGLAYKYILLLWLVSSQYPMGTQIKLDPRIVNRGTSK